MKLLILIGKDVHNYRILRGMAMANPEFEIFVSDISDTHESPDFSNASFSVWNMFPTDYKGKHFDLVLVDPTYSKDCRGDFTYDRLGFFDTEDAPDHVATGPAYELFKDDAIFYAKMDYPLLPRKDGIKYIGFPIEPYMGLVQVANAELPEFTHMNAIPFFHGSPTFLGRGGYYKDPEISGDIYFANDVPDGYIYNQRFQWLQSLQNNNIPYEGGIVFMEAECLSLEFQTKHFGNVGKFARNYIDRNTFFNMAATNRIGLNPAGNNRNSWRIYDLMAIGSIIVTGRYDMKSMYSPKQFITIEDDDDLGSVLREAQPDYKEMAKASKENRKVLADLTPDKVWNDFLGQM
tara:strand:- start:187 stop:1230 length:1044 start_codon:yes stop_codon:yes gene_type:complete